MGTVLRCHRKGEDVAVKMIRPNLLGNEDIRNRFAREAELLQSVDHPHVARIVGYDATNKTSPWLATEFIDGPNLREWVAENGAMGEQSWDELAEGVLSGLAAIHDTGILHRDIKPANVMLSPDGPKIIDFGISKEEGQTALTNTQMFAGTVAYLAPERVERNEESQASDLFSAGLVLAVAARGEHPWGDETTQTELAILMNMATEKPRLDGLTEKQQTLLRALLRRQPDLRPNATTALAILRGESVDRHQDEEDLKPIRSRAVKTRRIKKHFSASLAGALIRGFSTAVSAVVVFTLTGLLWSAGRGVELLTGALIQATNDLSNALRVQPSPVELDGLLSAQANLATALSLRPTLITFALIFVMAVWGKKYGEHVSSVDLKKRLFYVGAIALPTVAVVTGLSWLVPDSLGMMPWDGLFALLVLGLGFSLGLILGGYANDKSAALWWFSSMRVFSLLVVSVGVAVIIGGVTHGILTPDLAAATGNFAPGPFAEASFADIAIFAVAVLLFLPTLLFVAADVFLAGQGYAALRENSLVYLQVLSQPGELSPPIAFTPQSAILSGLFVLFIILAAIASGTITAMNRDTRLTGTRWLVQFAIFNVIFGLALFGLIRVSVESVPRLRGTFFIHTSVTQSLVLLALMALAALLVSVAMWVGGHHLVAPRIARFLPGVSSPVAPESTEIVPVGRRSPVLNPRALGFSLIAVTAIITLIIPPGLGAVERQWAQSLTPEKVLSDAALAMEIRDGKGLTELMPLAPGTNWVPLKALEEAQPMVGQRRQIDVTNSLGRPWKTGQLDPKGKVAWPVSGGSIIWRVDIDSDVENKFVFLRRASFTPDLAPITLDLSLTGQLGDIPGVPVRINGQVIAPGKYSLIPGAYTIERDEIGLIGGFEERVVVNSDNHSVAVSAALNLNDPEEKALNRMGSDTAESCGEVRRSSCFSSDDVYRAQRVTSGTTPSSSYARESTAFESGGLRCEPGEDILLSTTEIVREFECTQIVRYETKYWNSRQIAEPVFSTRCASWWYSWWFGATCLRWERYQSGTNYRTVRGDLIATVRYQSDMPIRVSVPAALDDSGEFVIGEPTVN